MNEQAQVILAALARHFLTTAGGFLVAHGYLQSSQTADFIGGGMVLLGVAWSWWQKTGQAQVSDLLKKLTTKTPAQAANISTTAAVEIAKTLPEGSAITPGLPMGPMAAQGTAAALAARAGGPAPKTVL
jgi:hypothetical protein